MTAATDDGVVQRWQRRGAVTASGDGEPVALPAAAASLSDRVRVLRWGIVAACEPRNLSRQSSPPFYRLRDGGPPASSWAGPPIRARGQGTSWQRPTGGDQFQQTKLTERVANAAKVLIRAAMVSEQVHGPWYKQLL